MSVAIKTNGKATYGNLVLTSNSDSLSGEDVINRINSIVNIIKAVDFEMMDKSDLYFMMDILQDHLPTIDQGIELYNPKMEIVKK